LGSGQRFGSEDLSRIRRVLDRGRITYQVDDLRRVAVPTDQRDQAEAAIAKLDLGPRLPGEIRDQLPTTQFWESPRDKELRENQEQAKILEAMISDLPGIVGSFVWINRPKPKLGLQPVVKPSAFVRLETEGDRQLPFRTVQSIIRILMGVEPGLTAAAVTVQDRHGHMYLDSGNPTLTILSHNRAREEELSQEILEQLDWIKGVRVSVQLPQLMRTAHGTVAAPEEPMRHDDSESQSRGPGSVANHQEVGNAVIAINRPLGAAEVASPPVSRAGQDTSAEPGRIWVRVPRSYYYQVSILPSHKEPSQEELQKLVLRTEEQIKTGIALVVPLAGPGSWKTAIDVIPDEVPLDRPPVVRSPLDSRRVVLDWGIAGAIGAMAAVLLVIAGSWILNARRSSVRTETVRRGLRRHAGTGGTPGPSERLREFVRRNPETAASVLELWTSQGGDA
jgi:hypothetical protein